MYEQMPDMQLLNETFRNTFHTYPIIYDIAGTRESVAATTLDDLELAYRMNYNDERMVLVIVSPKDPVELRNIIDVKVSTHPKSLDHVQDYFQIEPHEVVHEHRQIKAKVTVDKMSRVYKFPYEGDDRILDEFKLKMILDMNFTEMDSEYQNYIDQKIIGPTFTYDVDIQNDIAAIYFLNDGEQFDKFVKYVDDKMSNLTIDADLFEQLSRKIYGDMIFSLSNTNRIAITIARYHLDNENYYDFMSSIRSLSYESLYTVAGMLKDFSKTSLLLSNK